MVSEEPVPDIVEPTYYSCPYPPCDFVSDDLDEVVSHIGNVHAGEEEFRIPVKIGEVDEDINEEAKEVYLSYMKQREGGLRKGKGEEKESYKNLLLGKEVTTKLLGVEVTKSINISGEKPKNMEFASRKVKCDKNDDCCDLGNPNKRKVEGGSLLTKEITTPTSDGKKGIYSIPVVSYLGNYLTTKYYKTFSGAVEEKVFKSFSEFKDFTKDINTIYNSLNTLINIIKKRDGVKSSILLYLLRHKVVYLSFVVDKLLPSLRLNKNSVRGYLERLEVDGLIAKIPKEDEPQFKEIEELKILLQKYTRVGNHIHKIEFYCLSGIGGVLVNNLKEDLETVVPEPVMEQINDVYKGVIPREKRLEAVKRQQRIAEIEAEKVNIKKKQEAHEKKADKRLLELCTPFKKEIIKLKREVVMVKPSERENFTPELHAFVAKLQKKEEFMSPLGIRRVWQMWKKEEKE